MKNVGGRISDCLTEEVCMYIIFNRQKILIFVFFFFLKNPPPPKLTPLPPPPPLPIKKIPTRFLAGARHPGGPQNPPPRKIRRFGRQLEPARQSRSAGHRVPVHQDQFGGQPVFLTLP